MCFCTIVTKLSLGVACNSIYRNRNRRLKNVLENWKILTHDIEILSLVESYTIPIYKTPEQKKISNSPKSSQREKVLVQKEIPEMLNKKAFVETQKHLKRSIYQSFSY